ncbi:Protein kinase C signaling pathway involved MAPKK protein [Tulasnella sp. 403]|nr:Protein kinase C signaling pathway involved MAPKK protein [Tulasnella sp. 403]
MINTTIDPYNFPLSTTPPMQHPSGPRPRGGRPKPIHNGAAVNLAPSPPSAYQYDDPMVDSPESAGTPYSSRPSLQLSLPMPQARTPTIVAPGSDGSEPAFSLRPNMSLVYGTGAASASPKPSLKLGLKIGTKAPSLNLAIPTAASSSRGTGDSPVDSYYGMLPTNPPPPAVPNNSLATPMTEPFSAETLKPPIATIVPVAKNGAASTANDEILELHRAIEAISIKENDDETIQWDNSMFENVRRLGEGAGGAVYQVLQKSTGKMMAMKTIPANPETPPRQLRRELEFLSTCIHTNITEFYGAYLSGSNPSTADVVLLMEFCEGGSLETVAKKVRQQKRRIGEPIVAKLAEGILRGLDYLHERKIIHRDIKPSNILLTREGVVRLCDFGVSGVLINSMAGTFTGTSWYMSPERIRGDPYSIRSDVWSTGLTLLELARNKFPFSPDLGPIELLSVIVNGDIPELEDEPAGPDGEPGAIWTEAMKLFIKRCLIISGTERPSPREILQDPWLVENRGVQIEMDKWMRHVHGWPRPPRKGPRRTKQSEGQGSTSSSVDQTPPTSIVAENNAEAGADAYPERFVKLGTSSSLSRRSRRICHS